MSVTKLTLDTSTLIPVAMAELDSNTAQPRFAPGSITILRDAFGLRCFMYVKNVHSAALVLGDIAVKAADVAFTAGAVTKSTRVTTTGLTADAHVGKMLLVEGNDTSAGAAPEGETGIIVKNTATVIDLDARLPFSVSSVADVDCRIVTPGWHVIQGGAAALARDVKGVVVGLDGISVGYYGWVGFEGFMPQVKATAAAIAAGANIVTGATGAVATVGANTMEKVIGYAPGAVESTHPGKMPMVLTLWTARDVV